MRKSPLPVSLALIVLFAIAPSATTQEGPARAPKEPWRWSDDERLDARFNPDSIATRNALYQGSSNTSRGITESAENRRTEYVIEGRRNPELLFPHELFDVLVAGVDPRDPVREKARAALNPGIRSLGLNEETFWNQIDAAAHDYIAAQVSGHSGLGEAGSPCGRRNALEAAESSMGRETLYRVLYSVVAPTMVYSASTNFASPANELLKAARGCER